MDYLPIFKRLPSYFTQRPMSVKYGMSHQVYAELPSLNASILKKRTPLDMLWEMRCPDDRPPKDCFDLGGQLHCAVLEPERWQSEFHVYDGDLPTQAERARWSQPLIWIPPDAPKKPTKAQLNAPKPSAKAKESIDWWQDFTLRAGGRTIVSEEEYCRAMEWQQFQEKTSGKLLLTSAEHDQVMQMRAALFRHHEIRRLLEAPGENEAVVEVWDPEYGVMKKARFDRLPNKTFNGKGDAVPSFVLDVKTTSANIDSDWAIRNEILKWGYHIQARYYLDILAAVLDEPARDRFYIPFVTTKEPYKARLYELHVQTPGDNLLIDAGNILYQRGEHTVGRLPMFIDAAHEFIQRVRECHEDPLGAWTAYEHEPARLVEASTNRN
ncbi:hypothetical protein SAMN02745166_01048 [Prosthecobacter debontii]|uniref:Putative exodeoxyribonuclease 8 PDDEXK-like domain-containing protein n=1 Tax=Prosthecobacter debontii TaxID=48467 RepID=A0A1T4X5K6_9BACT|nr:PD-(D/E)XK nuclease-like domain-containing protein [Prosthecobacter debontii]SKA84709.1 hypothetical protein SAMN02745166_01048 [Prosthecobacter debontii]